MEASVGHAVAYTLHYVANDMFGGKKSQGRTRTSKVRF